MMMKQTVLALGLVLVAAPASAAPPDTPADASTSAPPDASAAPATPAAEVDAVVATLTAPADDALLARMAKAVRVARAFRGRCRGVPKVARGRARRTLAACLRGVNPVELEVTSVVQDRGRVRAVLRVGGTPYELDPVLLLELRPVGGTLEITAVDWRDY